MDGEEGFAPKGAERSNTMEFLRTIYKIVLTFILLFVVISTNIYKKTLRALHLL